MNTGSFVQSDELKASSDFSTPIYLSSTDLPFLSYFVSLCVPCFFNDRFLSFFCYCARQVTYDSAYVLRMFCTVCEEEKKAFSEYGSSKYTYEQVRERYDLRQTSKLLLTPVHSPCFLVESTPPEIVCDDDVRDSIEDELHVLGVGGAGHVAVDLLRRGLVLRLELSLDVRGSFAVLLRPYNGQGEEKIHSGALASLQGQSNLLLMLLSHVYYVLIK